MISIVKIFHFSAAHHLPDHKGQCKNIHGHNYQLEVEISGLVKKASGMVLDFTDLDQIVHEEVIDKVDHTNLNDLFDNPTAEEMLEYFSCVIMKRLRADYLHGIKLERLTLWETEKCHAIWKAEEN